MTVELSEQDAQSFLLFQKHYELMKLIDSLGGFEVKSGSLVIHFDNLGHAGSVDIQRHYRF